jgi:hypothetical protein
MRNLLSRIESLEERFDSVGCTCTSTITLHQRGESPLSPQQIQAQVAERHSCPAHAEYRGPVVIVTRFSKGPLTHTGIGPGRSTVIYDQP